MVRPALGTRRRTGSRLSIRGGGQQDEISPGGRRRLPYSPARPDGARRGSSDGRLDRLLGFRTFDLRQCSPSRRALPQDCAGHPRAAAAGAAVLDYGCGEALHADIVAETAGRLILCEAAPMVRAALAAASARIRRSRCARRRRSRRSPPGRSTSWCCIRSRNTSARRSSTSCSSCSAGCCGADGVFILGDIIPPHVSALGRCGGASAFCRAQRISRRRAGRARAHVRLRLLAPALEPRSHPLRRSGGDGEADPRGVLGAARAGEYRPQPRPHDVPGAAGVSQRRPALSTLVRWI